MTDKEKFEMERDLIIPRDVVGNELQRAYEAGFLAGSMGGKVLPHPCDGELYKDCGTFDYLCKIAEEYNEVMQASLQYNNALARGLKSAVIEKRRLMLECTDLIVAVTSYMDKLGCVEKARQQYMKQVNWSNSQRDGGRRFKWK